MIFSEYREPEWEPQLFFKLPIDFFRVLKYDRAMNEQLTTERLWTSKQLAEAAGITQRRVLQLLNSGEICGQRLDRWQFVVSDSEARRWLASRGVSVEH